MLPSVQALLETVALLPEYAHFTEELATAERPGQLPGHLAQIEAAAPRLRRQPQGVIRITRDVFDRATGCVAAIQVALRALEHLDALDIAEHLDISTQRTLQIHIVDVDSDTLLESRVRTDTPDEGRESACDDRILIDDRRVGHDALQIGGVIDLQLANLLGSERCDRGGHVLQVLLALARGDDHFLELVQALSHSGLGHAGLGHPGLRLGFGGYSRPFQQGCACRQRQQRPRQPGMSHDAIPFEVRC